MTTNNPSIDQRRRRQRWLVGGAIAAVAIIAVALLALLAPGSLMSQPSPTPSNGASPKTPAVPGTSPTVATGTPNATPRNQPTENGDSAPRETKDPVAITAEATPTEGISARLVRIESVEGEVAIPGEVGGPALRVTLEVTNNTADDFVTPAVVVNLYTGEAQSPAGPLLNPGGKEFPSEIGPGDSARGVYLFTVGAKDRDDVTIEVDLAVGTPIVLFQGPIN